MELGNYRLLLIVAGIGGAAPAQVPLFMHHYRQMKAT